MKNKWVQYVLFFASVAIANIQHLQAQSLRKTTWLNDAIAAKEAVLAKHPKDLPVITKTLRRGDTPQFIDVNVEGINELVLIAWATDDGPSFDHAAWADAAVYTKDGKKIWLDELPIKYKSVEGDWFRLKTSYGGQFAIADKKFSTGILAHANSVVIYDLTNKGICRFSSWVGIDNAAGNEGSAVFKVLTTTGDNEAVELVDASPDVASQFVPYLGTTLQSWLTTPGIIVEKEAITNIISVLKDNNYITEQLKHVEAITNADMQKKAYAELLSKAGEVLRLQTELEGLNIKGVKLAYNDFKKTPNYNLAKWQAQYDKFMDLIDKHKGFKGIYTLESQAVNDLNEVLRSKREILLSNPALDFDKIIAAQYNIGPAARAKGAEAMGTPNSNWSSQLSTPRDGFEASIVELTNLRETKPTIKTLYKPTKNAAITSLQLHWDANRLIFTSQDDKRRWQVFEMNANGDNLRQAIIPEDEDVELFDASYLPDGNFIVNTNLGYQGVPCIDGDDPVANAALYNPKTKEMRRLCFDQENNWNPSVMNNGKVMYTRWEYTDLMHYYSRMVFTMNPDGTEQKALYGSGSYFPNATFDMQPLPGGSSTFIGIVSGHHGVVHSGRLMIFDPAKSRKEEKGMVQEIPFSNRPIIPIVKDELVNGVWPQFTKPFPITDKYFIVSAKPTQSSLWGIYLVDIYDNMLLLGETEGNGYTSPIPVKKRTTPPVIPSKVDLTKNTSTVFIQDIYEGEGLVGVPRGTVKKLRVLTYEFAYLSSPSNHLAQGVQSGWDIKRELGEVDVESDGSVIFTVPANTPISLQPLDSKGRAIQLMRSWLTGMPGEVVSCIGCHEDQNSIVIPKRVIASQKHPQSITPPQGGVRSFTFELEIQPILNRACIACHNGEGDVPRNFTPGRIDNHSPHKYSMSYLDFHPYFYRQGPEAEMAVLNPYEYATMNSEMFQILENNHHGVVLTDDEIKTLYKWLDFNAPYNGSFVAKPYRATAGLVIDQKQRRRQLAEKYAGAHTAVDWEKELSDYADSLKAKGTVTPVLPEIKTAKKHKIPTVKGWPFTPEKAKEMVINKQPRTINVGNGQQITFVYIPAGTFIAGGDGKAQTKIPYKTTIKKGFWMSETEITNAQLKALIPTHDSRYVGQFWKDHTTPGYDVRGDELAATKVSYLQAEKYAQLLSEKSGLNIMLPTEEQWEWAARAGSDNDFWFGDIDTDFTAYENLADVQLTKMAVSGIDPQPMSSSSYYYKYLNYIPKHEDRNDGNMLVTAPAKYAANPWGLYDMNGNVAEWTRSNFERSSDPSMIKADKVVRGGSWYERTKRAAVAVRRNFLPWQAPWNVGMRLIIED
ncbi:MAG: SUMF1/EgtB/PvdO family nonheme iron enzyme [Marinifilaceae bacterium]